MSSRKDIAYLSDIKNKADLVRGKVPSSQLPSYVDEAVEYPSRSDFPATGNKSLIYVALDTGLSYRWTGSTYIDFTMPEVVAPTAEALPGQAADAAATYQAIQQGGGGGGAKFIVVNSLPSAAAADPLAIYLVPKASAQTQNIYDEYVRVEPTEGTYAWEKIGDTQIDLSGYATKEDATLNKRGEHGSEYSEWEYGALTVVSSESGDWTWIYEQPQYSNGTWTTEITNGPDFATMVASGAADATSLDFYTDDTTLVEAIGSAARTRIPGLVLGDPDSQSNPNANKPLAGLADLALVEQAMAGKASIADATLAPMYSGTWSCEPTAYTGDATYSLSVVQDGKDVLVRFSGDGTMAGDYGRKALSPGATSVSWSSETDNIPCDVSGSLSSTGRKVLEYVLGTQTSKPLATAEQGAKADTAIQPVAGATAGHFAGLDANGGLTDSGKGASDFMAADAKVNHIYNTAGTDALDDKGGLFDSTIVQSKWVVPDGYDSQDIEYSYSSYANGIYKWDSGWWKLGRLEYNANTGAITFLGFDTYGIQHNTNVATVTKHLDPRQGDVLPNFDGKTLYIDNQWKSGMSLRFTATDIDLKSTPYAHLALESVPDREYSNTSTYAVGDLVKYGNPAKAYRCNTAITTAENWTAAHWTEIPVLAQKQDALTFDTAPTAGSMNPVTSGGIKTAIDNIKVQKVYNAAGTDALDDKGQLFKSAIETGGHWEVDVTDRGVTTHYKYLYVRDSGSQVFWEPSDGSWGSLWYTKNDGSISWASQFVLSPSAPSGLNPTVTSQSEQLVGTYTGSNSRHTVVATYIPQQPQLESTPYTHLAVETVPTRTIEASTAYAVGDLLGDSGKAYRCISAYTSAATPVAPSSDTTHWTEIPTLANAGGGTPLAGNTYDFSLNADIVKAVADVARALGATVNNDPTESSDSSDSSNP